MINKKQRSFEEFIEVLSSARGFKKWLNGITPDESLLGRYVEDIGKAGWLNSTKGKTLRYVVSNGIAKLYPSYGTVASIFDSFLLDKLVSGWKPNQFVEERFRPFVDPD